MKRRDILAALGAGAAWAALGRTWAAPPYPERAIRLLIPFSPGGSTDVFGRRYGQAMGQRLGQSVVVENKAGAAGAIAAMATLRAPADGYTLMLGTSSNTTAGPATNPAFEYDPRKDFSAIGIMGVQPMVLAVNPGLPAHTLAELVALLRANPGKYSYGSGGIGGISHLTGEFFKDRAGGLKLEHIVYKGSGPALQDLLAGRVQVMFDSAVPHLPFVQAGKVRILATFWPKRIGALPDVPTTREAGYPDLVSATALFLLGPRGIAPEVSGRLQGASRETLSDLAFRRGMSEMGIEPPDEVSAASAARYIAEDMDKWARIARNISLQLG